MGMHAKTVNQEYEKTDKKIPNHMACKSGFS